MLGMLRVVPVMVMVVLGVVVVVSVGVGAAVRHGILWCVATAAAVPSAAVPSTAVPKSLMPVAPGAAAGAVLVETDAAVR